MNLGVGAQIRQLRESLRTRLTLERTFPCGEGRKEKNMGYARVKNESRPRNLPTSVGPSVPLQVLVRFERVRAELAVEDLLDVDRVLQQVRLQQFARFERPAALVALVEPVRFGVQLHVDLEKYNTFNFSI